MKINAVELQDDHDVLDLALRSGPGSGEVLPLEPLVQAGGIVSRTFVASTAPPHLVPEMDRVRAVATARLERRKQRLPLIVGERAKDLRGLAMRPQAELVDGARDQLGAEPAPSRGGR